MRTSVLFIVLLICVLVGINAQNKQKDYLKENATKPGVTVLPSGVQYKIVESGTAGSHPQPEDSVKVNYAGSTVDGKEFDSSYSRGQPATFGVNQVIRGWTEVLQLMVPGDVWEVVIPSELAYGARGAGGLIGPHATLIFKIELIAIE
jgi:FKBP-type peptidyl-prolyl cis-trans isomerase FklB